LNDLLDMLRPIGKIKEDLRLRGNLLIPDFEKHFANQFTEIRPPRLASAHTRASQARQILRKQLELRAFT
jgi:hypothetical protein